MFNSTAESKKRGNELLMKPLDKTLRNTLERTIKKARKTAEDAAKATLEQLGVPRLPISPIRNGSCAGGCGCMADNWEIP